MISDVAKSLAKAILDGDEVAVSALRDVLAETEDLLQKSRFGSFIDVNTMESAKDVCNKFNTRNGFYVVVYKGNGTLKVGDVVKPISFQSQGWYLLRLVDWTVHGTTTPASQDVMVCPANKVLKNTDTGILLPADIEEDMADESDHADDEWKLDPYARPKKTPIKKDKK